ncbi:MAG: spermidine synthase [Pirellulaceae bacterium]
MRLARSAVVVSLGFFALAAQTVLFRDFLAAFESNELGVGSFFGAWLLWVALGAVAGRLAARSAAVAACPFELLALLYIPAFLLQQLLIANARELGGVSVYETYPFAKMLVVAIWINAPVSLVTGCLFTLACRWSARAHTLPVAHVYILETLGSFAGGVVVTLLLVLGASTETVFVTAVAILLITAGLSLVLQPPEKRALPHLALVIVPLVALGLLIPSGLVRRWADTNRHAAWRKLLPPQAYLGCFTTAQAQYLYGQREGQFLVMSSGGVVETIPAAEHAAEVVAISLAQRPETKRVLVIGPGSYGICTQFRALPHIQQVVWLHPDAKYPQELMRVLPGRWRDPTGPIDIPADEVRPYLEHHPRHFDLILLHLPDATTLAMNRFWTREFYAIVKEALVEDGVICTRVSGAANYMGGELVYLGSSALQTIQSSFQNVVLKPGDESWIIASDGNQLSDRPDVLRDRFAALQGAASVYPPEGLLSLYLPDRAEFQLAKYRETITATPQRVLLNSDQRPQALLFSTMLALRRANLLFVAHRLPTLLAGGLWIVVCPILVYGMLRLVYLVAPSPRPSCRGDNHHGFDGLFLILSTGLTGMSLSILLMFLYQSRFGALYLHIGLISSLFMLGSCLGSLFVERLLRSFEAHSTTETGTRIADEGTARMDATSPRSHLGSVSTWLRWKRWPGSNIGPFLSACLSLHLVFLLLVALVPDQLPRWCYGLLFVGCGSFVGIYFPIVALLHRRESRRSERSGAILETLDHLGGAAGAVLIGWILIPLLGTPETLLVLGLLVAVNLGPWWIGAPAVSAARAADRFDQVLRPL